eukprot:COSAG03_NODE_2454_length_2741_cov_5.927113_2_plen_283_part_00
MGGARQKKKSSSNKKGSRVGQAGRRGPGTELEPEQKSEPEPEPAPDPGQEAEPKPKPNPGTSRLEKLTDEELQKKARDLENKKRKHEEDLRRKQTAGQAGRTITTLAARIKGVEHEQKQVQSEMKRRFDAAEVEREREQAELDRSEQAPTSEARPPAIGQSDPSTLQENRTKTARKTAKKRAKAAVAAGDIMLAEPQPDANSSEEGLRRGADGTLLACADCEAVMPFHRLTVQLVVTDAVAVGKETAARAVLSVAQPPPPPVDLAAAAMAEPAAAVDAVLQV